MYVGKEVGQGEGQKMNQSMLAWVMVNVHLLLLLICCFLDGSIRSLMATLLYLGNFTAFSSLRQLGMN
jgi:hypothetical protein